MEDTGGLTIFGGLILIFGIIGAVLMAIAYVIYMVVIAIVYLVIAAVVCAMFLGLGIGANLLVRTVIGLLAVPELSPRGARFGLVAIMVAPLVVIALGLLSAGVDGGINLVWLGVLLLSVPAYYLAYFANEIPRLRVTLELPFKSEAALRAEGKIWLNEMVTAMVERPFRAMLLGLVLKSRLVGFWEGR